MLRRPRVASWTKSGPAASHPRVVFSHLPTSAPPSIAPCPAAGGAGRCSRPLTSLPGRGFAGGFRLERGEQFGQELIELLFLGHGQVIHEFALASGTGSDVFLELGAPSLRELEQHASAIVWIGNASDQTTTLELVETVGHRPRRDV